MEDRVKVLTSGRFDPPHPGHFCNILSIAKKGPVKVVILDSKNRKYPISYVKKIMEEVLKYTIFTIEIVVNTDHFAEITRDELDAFGCDLYMGGNLKVLKHIENLGFPVEFIDRSFYYEASKIPFPE